MGQVPPRFSVVIPVYQRAHVVGRALRSVLAQTWLPAEILVVDDGSTDAVEAAVHTATAEASVPTRVLRHDTNRGANAARNTGIEAASGSWVSFLDSDDVWHRNRLARHAEAIQAIGDRAGVIYSAFEIVRTDGSIDDTSPYQSCVREPVSVALGRRNVVGTFSTASVRADVLRTVGPLDESLSSCQDWDLWIRCAQHTSFHCIDEKLLTYTGGYAGRRITARPEIVREGHETLLRKHRAFIRAAGGEGHLFHRLGDVCMREPDVKAARRYFGRAVRENPRRVRWWLKWLASWCGVRTFRRLRNALRRLRRTRLGDLNATADARLQVGDTS